jgi:hypothetical protein
MDRQTRRLFLVALAGVAIIAAVAAYVGRSASEAGRPDGPTVDGVVIQVESAGLASVSGFTLRANDGRLLRFGLLEQRNATQFAPGHLPEHVATSAPIRVWYRDAGGALEALWLEDAPAAPTRT